MSRPTSLVIEPSALLHNLSRIMQLAPNKKVIAMVKANAYGCGIKDIVPVLEGRVDAFGVACLEEALAIKKLGSKTPCILFQGVFSPDEYHTAVAHDWACVIHQPQQLDWLLNTPLPKPIKIWVKVNTGMHRLGVHVSDVEKIINQLLACDWVNKDIGLMTHLACADEALRAENLKQISLFNAIKVKGITQRSIANSATLISFPNAHADAVRPGMMLYGVSPFFNKTSLDLGLIPVMRFMSAISAINHIPKNAQVGYGGAWVSGRPSVIGIIPAGYGDGYPKHILENTPVWIKGREVPIVGRVSMDMMTVDLTDHPDILVGEPVELWGPHLLVERIAHAAGTIGYELYCQISERVRANA